MSKLTSKDLTITYRPKSWEAVKGQARIVQILRRQAVAKKGLSNAYIFSGHSGVGKTTIARLFFMALNCEKPQNGNPCLECPACKNVKYCLNEVDGATNRGIDNVRELQKSAYYVPVRGKYTAILIDEAHMLSKPAYNALLKSIEEPPAGHIWLFATTELHSISKTIQTRCQIFKLSPMSWTIIHHRLKEIADKENIEIKDQDLWNISQASGNNLRQAIHLLEQYSNADNVEKKEVKYDLLDVLSKRDFKGLLEIFGNWEDSHEKIKC